MDPPHLIAEHRDFRRRVRAVLDEIVIPNAERWEDQGHIDDEGWRALAGHGLLGLAHSGEGFLYSAVLLEELGQTGYAGVRAAVGVHTYMALSYIDSLGTRQLRADYLHPARAGERIAALAISEEGAGTDLRQLRTWAEPRGEGGFRVSGEKLYVANGSRAGFYITLAKTRRTPAEKGLTGASLLIIDADEPGVTRHPQPMLGWKSADICRITLDSVNVPADRLLGRPDRALVHLMRGLDFERLVAGLLAVGGAGYCLDLLHRFVRRHRVRDAPLSANQAIRHRLAELSSDLDLVRTYAYHAAWLHSRGRLDPRVAATLKLKATELSVTAAQACVQYHGAQGYLDDSDPARIYRDAMAGTVAAGPSELMREMIFEEITA